MKFSTETIGQIYAQGRNYSNLILGFATGVGVLSAAQSKNLTDSLTEIWNGVSMIIHGATSFWQALIIAFPIIGGLLAKWASNSAKTDNQAKAVKIALADPDTPVSLDAKAAVLDSTKLIPEVTTPTINVSDPILAQLTDSASIKVAK